MEWEFKMPPWDLTELEQNTGEDNLSSVASSSGSRTGGLDCSVDLKLGGLGDFRVADKRRPFAMPMKMSATAHLKRPRVLSGGSQNVSCLVDGCRNDLSHCREYHRRHKVCEEHSKTPIVLVGGQEQRFCQQCSRFHLLVEFDDVKRSCRKRLDGHNRRRRKPQPDLVSGNLFPNLYACFVRKHHPCTTGLRFPTYPQIFPTAAADSNWSTIIKSEEYTLRAATPPPPQHFCSSFTWSFKEGKQLPFLNDDEMVLSSRTTLQPISSAAESSSREIVLTNGIPPSLDSDCALSLLSSSTNTPSISPGQDIPVQRRIQAADQSMLSSLDYGIGLGLYSHFQATTNNVSMTTGFLCSGIENEHVSSVLVSDAIEADLHCQRIFHVEGEGNSDRDSHSLPFSWY